MGVRVVHARFKATVNSHARKSDLFDNDILETGISRSTVWSSFSPESPSRCPDAWSHEGANLTYKNLHRHITHSHDDIGLWMLNLMKVTRTHTHYAPVHHKSWIFSFYLLGCWRASNIFEMRTYKWASRSVHSRLRKRDKYFITDTYSYRAKHSSK